MSFLSNIKKVFGFEADGEEFNDMSDGEDVVTHTDETEESPAQESQTETISVVMPESPVIDPDKKARIFDYAVAVFNESLPDFLKNSVDPAAQSRRLAEGLDKGIAGYLDSIMVEAQQYAEARLKSAADTAHAESERLRKEMESLDQQRTTLREQKLSADRRHRALSDRVKDLEAQLATADAEREQLDLEKRSLMNKLKVADLQPGVVEEMAAEIETLKARLESESNPAMVSENELNALKSENAGLKSQLEEAQAAGAEVEKLRTELDKAWVEVNDARAAAEKAEAEAADLRTQQEAVQGMYNDLHTRFGEEKDAREKAERELGEARAMTDGINEIQEQMNKVEDVIRKRDEKIARLKASNKKLREQLVSLEETLRRNLPHDDGLFGINDEEPAGQAGQDPFSADAMSAMEEDFECPDWFVSEPAPGETSPLLTSDAEFGYQEPPRKPKKPENDAQLSLF